MATSMKVGYRKDRDSETVKAVEVPDEHMDAGQSRCRLKRHCLVSLVQVAKASYEPEVSDECLRHQVAKELAEDVMMLRDQHENEASVPRSVMRICGKPNVEAQDMEELARIMALGMVALVVFRSAHTMSLLISLPLSLSVGHLAIPKVVLASS